jgi:two-component system sensor histidine kinase KdpD
LPDESHRPSNHRRVRETDGRPTAEELLRDLGSQPRLTVYLGYAPGTGKTHRLLTEARSLMETGEKVALGWIETKGRPDLEELAAGLPRILPRVVRIGEASFEEFDLDAALASGASAIVIDELAHSNLAGGRNVKRWEDALELRNAGRTVIGAFNVQHLETVAPAAEAMIGFPVREIVPISFLRAAEQVVAVDASPEVVEARLHEGSIVSRDDVPRALQGPFRPQTLRALRAMLLQTIDELARVRGETTELSVALVLVPSGSDATEVLSRASAIANAMNLSLEVAPAQAAPLDEIARRAARSAGARLTTIPDIDSPRMLTLADFHASLVALPLSDSARRLAAGPAYHDLLVIDTAWAAALPDSQRPVGFDRPFGQTLADRQRIGYGKLTVYLGAAAGCGKTYAMLDRAHQLQDAGVDVVAAFVETHGRKDTARMLEGLTLLPRVTIEANGVIREELDLEGLLARKPAVALIDELAHTNAPGSAHAKRWLDVLTVVRAGISVITTLNIQHLEGLNDVVRRLTGVTVRETIADPVLEYADEVVLIDASPQTLRDRLRAGKIYPKERVEAALSSFFQTENLLALRELAVREALRSRKSAASGPRVGDLILGVAGRGRDVTLIRRCARMASRLGSDLHVVHVTKPRDPRSAAEPALEAAALEAGAKWAAVISDRPARALARRALLAGAILVVEGARAKTAFLAGPSFARRTLDEGAVQLLVLAPAPA